MFIFHSSMNSRLLKESFSVATETCLLPVSSAEWTYLFIAWMIPSRTLKDISYWSKLPNNTRELIQVIWLLCFVTRTKQTGYIFYLLLPSSPVCSSFSHPICSECHHLPLFLTSVLLNMLFHLFFQPVGPSWRQGLPSLFPTLSHCCIIISSTELFVPPLNLTAPILVIQLSLKLFCSETCV